MLTAATTAGELMSITVIMLRSAIFPIISLFEWGGQNEGSWVKGGLRVRVRVLEFGSTTIKRSIPLEIFQDEMPSVIVFVLVVAVM
jgi:hypothetical protein